MAGQSSEGAVASSSERMPLLAGKQPSESDESKGSIKKAAKFMAENAVVICITLLTIALVVILCTFFVFPTKKPPTKTSVCLTAACVHASSEILYNLSPDYKSLDPCTNFEELVCGGWDDRHDLRPDQGDAFTGTIMSENSQMLLRHILEAPYPNESKHSSFSPAQLVQTLSSVDEQNFDKLRDAYNACMDEDAIKKVGIKPLRDLLIQVARLYPTEARHDNDLYETILFLTEHGVSSLVEFGVGADDKDPDTVVVSVQPPYRIGLPAKNYYTDDDVLKKYQDALTQTIDKFHPDNKNNKEFSKEVIELEKKLAAASPDSEDRDDVTQYYNPMTLKEADGLAPQIHLAELIGKLEPTKVQTKGLIVSSPSYMSNLTSILSASSRGTLQTYFTWKAIQAYASYVEADEIKPYTRFANDLQGKDPDSTPERWRTCVGHADEGLGWILSRFFVEKAFSEKAKIFGDTIVTDIKDQFIEKLKVTTWMDKSVIDLAIEKVHKIVQKIGYPTKSPNIMDPPSLRSYYKSVEVNASSFFQNAVSINRFDVKNEWAALSYQTDRDAWGMTVPTVNAYYNPPGNEIVFPAGIMQFPVFDVNAPQYLSYGAFGSVSGHELSHAFDSTGRHYDQNGNYTDWWTTDTVAAFKERAECFVDQYSHFTVPGPNDEPLHVNGRLTLGENIADAGGITAAFAAWKKRAAETPNEDLPGLEHFTQEQLFFVGYAGWWCGKTRKEAAIDRIYSDPHAPKWARILGTMANSRDFKNSFQCKEREPVCEIW
ncbi:peptidase family M13 [Amylocarpus encephaloides]|uniref:Peptidase family M13 n=1 Tax=Amylocarpus encephaloides TaxID=45428 RepID=A0A9P7YJ85_9HELO|nr:peptidase family M13 [Amylocarpus encephaloides]